MQEPAARNGAVRAPVANERRDADTSARSNISSQAFFMEYLCQTVADYGNFWNVPQLILCRAAEAVGALKQFSPVALTKLHTSKVVWKNLWEGIQWNWDHSRLGNMSLSRTHSRLVWP